MGLPELFLIGVGLSMDAFAVAVCRGLSMRRLNWGHALIIALYFGGFQALMPLLGWLLGSRFAGYIQSVDHWIAFVLLALIGGNMVREAFGEGDDCAGGACESGDRLDYKQLFLMAVATSIDALAVGVTFAFLSVSIVPAVSIIGVTTFCLSVAGVVIGNVFGARYKRRAEITGGIILILLGAKILIEHLLS
ncbi:MAG: manganese efflux pump MntP family protein [Oscillibacter sp.]|jgi:putative Mn2+ efflux pump MntP|nr:manganese efflux pump MntP family protein [Oscillibacter sp.]